jgi:membrane-associated phospholipid phosphatase
MTDVATMLGLIPDAGSRTFFGYNEFAAMPSLHIAWSALIAVAWFKMKWKWGKILSSVYLVLMTLAVVATANHYVLDVVAGVLLLVFAAWAVGWPTRLKRLLEDRDMRDLRELGQMVRRWPHPFPETGFRMGYHRNYTPQSVLIHHAVRAQNPYGDSPWGVFN